MTAADVLVVGGGPAGAAAAARLAAAGLRVVLLERQGHAGRQVCGEFLSPGATAELGALGLDPARLGARPITRTRISGHGADRTARLPFTAWGLSRARLDQSLLETASRCGAEVRMGVGVRAIEPGRHGWSAALADGGRMESGAIVLATGKHDLRGHARAPGSAPAVVGFKMHCRLRPDQAAALGGAVELFLYDGGYAGLQLIEDGAANLCLVVRADRLRGGGRPWSNALAHLRTVAPGLAERLCAARPLWDRPLSIARIPYGYVCASDAGPQALYRVGDQAAVIPSWAGEGIAIALRSARLAADAVLAGETAGRHAEAVRGDVQGPMRRARVIESVLRHRPSCRLALGMAGLPGMVPLLARLTRVGASPA